ncbi:MAG: hypothetical protein COB88_09180 [Flavobacteriales bacterium]|nr:MAG: hypothetical protein COB88_09180 [Flavobacteriales bacterium]
MILCSTQVIYSQNDTLSDSATYIVSSRYDGILFGANFTYDDEYLGQVKVVENVIEYRCKKQNWTPWTPTLANIEELEKRLPKAIRKNKLKEYTYTRQYFGVKDYRGNKYIYVNGFGSHKKRRLRSWKVRLVTVRDGGDCYFNCYYLIAEKKISEFQVQGMFR